MKIGLIGLGQMGRGMAARLLDTGHSLVVYNRTPAAAEGFRGRARVAKHPDEALEAEVVITMLADDAAVEAVWKGLELPAEAVHLNMATVSTGMAERLAARQRRYVSAPVFGRPPLAARGELDIIAAGERESLERCAPLFSVLAKQVFIVGEAPAQANAVKIARNFLLATVIESLGEAMALIRACGVPPAEFLKIITGTSLAAPAYSNYGRMMVEEAYEPAQFAMPLGLKDVELALATAREKGVRLPSAELIRGHLQAAIAAGGAERDWVSLAEFLRGSG